jgi:hypothetical protein
VKSITTRIETLEAACPKPERNEPPDAETMETARKMLPDGSAGDVHALAVRLQHPETLSDAELLLGAEIIAAKYGLTVKEAERLAVAQG